MTKLSSVFDRFMLYACDQKIEHLNKNFYGPQIPTEINDPAHLFKIAASGRISAMATQLGMIEKYGPHFSSVPYVAKLNSKTNIVPTAQRDPFSRQLWSVEQALQAKKRHKLSIIGVGITVYLGSEYEDQMLEQAANMVYQAQLNDLISILWMYPRGQAVTNDRDGMLIAGAAGVACALGADFAKVNPPHESEGKSSAEWLAVASQAAGTTKLICSGGVNIPPRDFLQSLYEQIHIGHTSGNATGRNIFAYPLTQAIAMTQAIAAITLDGASIEDAIKLVEKKKA